MKKSLPKTDARRNIAKLFLNSLYGIFGITPDDTSIFWVGDTNAISPLAEEAIKRAGISLKSNEILTVDAESAKNLRAIRQFLNKRTITPLSRRGNNKFTINVGIAAYVTAMSRILLVKGMNSVGFENVIYADTDSLIFLNDNTVNLDTGSNLGQ
jgi:hypothetical protein